jgi:hypothetical protein
MPATLPGIYLSGFGQKYQWLGYVGVALGFTIEFVWIYLAGFLSAKRVVQKFGTNNNEAEQPPEATR